MSIKLTIGNKNYSSWSMRPWIAMKVAGIAFEETVISLSDPHFKSTLLQSSPAGKVPVLIDSDPRLGDVYVWESLAILEYLAERFPAANLWPANPKVRAHARAISNEMHAGFIPLRRYYPMNMWRPVAPREPTPEVAANIKRIDDMWSHCRASFGGTGRFLFGTFSAADAMYAPVVARFFTYAVDVSASTRTYMDAMMALPAWSEWRTAALKEPWVLPEDEPDWPTVLRVEAAEPGTTTE
jgi:glutathione S-transferase